MNVLKSITVYLSVFCLFVSTASAEEVSGWSGMLEFGGLKNTGNANTLTLDGSLEVIYTYDVWKITLTADGTKTEQDNTTSSEYYDVDLKTLYNFPNSVYLFSEFYYREDVFRGIIYQWSALGGLGYHLFQPENHSGWLVDIELGKGKRQSKEVSHFELDHDPINHGALMAEYLWSKDDLLKGEIRIEWGNDDQHTEGELSWVHTLFESVTIDLSYNQRTASKPSANNVWTDTKTTVKLGYSF